MENYLQKEGELNENQSIGLVTSKHRSKTNFIAASGGQMKNPKKLTFKEHLYLQTINLNSDNWLISKKTSAKWTMVHKYTGQVKEVYAP